MIFKIKKGNHYSQLKIKLWFGKSQIDQLLRALELDYEYCVWDGFKLRVNYPFDHTTECDRNDLIEYLPELDYRDVEEIGGVQDEYNCDNSIQD